MTIKPGVFSLSSESYKFVRANVDVFKAHLVIIFPLFLVVAVAKVALKVQYGIEMASLMNIPIAFLLSCFMLSWHKTSLQGPSAAHATNPFTMSKNDWGFILLYTVMSCIYSAVLWAIDEGLMRLFFKFGEGYGVLFDAANFLLALAVTYIFIRLVFLLPARSIGVSLTLKDASRASKGMVWPIIGSAFIFVLLFSVAFALYTFISGMIVTMAAGVEQAETVDMAIIGYILSIPVYIAIFALFALLTTALSKAYQWGIQNNPHTNS